jgi:predicted nucleotidyltransferase
MDSDIDLAAEFDPAARMDLLRLSAVERRIAEPLGSPVDLLPEPALTENRFILGFFTPRDKANYQST